MDFSGSSRGQSNVLGSSNSTNNGGTIMGWDAWELNNNNNNATADWNATSSDFFGIPPPVHHAPPSLYGGGDTHAPPDPHLVCLKLGKRDYFEDHAQRMAVAAGGRKKGKGVAADVFYGSSTAIPRCQVEGCHVALVNAKDYHRRHKVCEVHSKAPKVSVLGLEQRFCQQCSRFHVVSEFEEAKRSCKRRLAGHNERRRKSSHDSIPKNSSFLENNRMVTYGGYMYGRNSVPSLLSSNESATWDTTSELASRSSAALQELIAENRARQLEAGGHVTLDFMQAPGPAPVFAFAPPGSRAPNTTHVTKAEDDVSCDLWNSF